MIRHYLASAVGNILKAPFTTAANVLTLALGLTCFLAAFSIVTFWRGADTYHQGAERIAFISYSMNPPNATGPRMMNQVAPPVLERFLRQDFPEFEAVSRAISSQEAALAAGGQKIMIDLAYTDKDFTQIFDFDFVEGDKKTALTDPNGVVLTRETAQRLFGNKPALGQSVIVEGKDDAAVTGVIAPVRQPSFMGQDNGVTMHFDAIRQWDKAPFAKQVENVWGIVPAYVIVKLKPGASLASVRARLPDFLNRRLPANAREAAAFFIDAFPISRMRTLGIENGLSSGAGPNLSAISVMLGLGLLTLIVACANYANLATAQSLIRNKEIGMRKTLGARRWSIMLQAWTETTLLSLAAFAVAVIVLLLAAPSIRANLGVDPLYMWGAGPQAIASVVGIVLFTAFIAGAYPALKLSGARPADALRSGRAKAGSQLVSRILVMIQFVSASFLLIMVTVMQAQRTEVEHAALASHGEPIAVLNSLKPLGIDPDTVEAQLRQSPAIRNVTFVMAPPWGYFSANPMNLSRSLDQGAPAPGFSYANADYGYFDTLSLKLLAGRVFERDRDTIPVSLARGSTTITPALVVDRLAAEKLGFASPQEAIGKIVYVPESIRKGAGLAALPVEIVGVVESEMSSVEASPLQGHIYAYGPKAFGQLVPVVKFAKEDVAGAEAHVRRVWDQIAPNMPLKLRWYDGLFAEHYRMHAQFGGMFMLLAGAAFIISTVGLLGIAVHAASRRRHEIAVRKTLGSSAARIVRLLLTDFSVPVLIGNLLAWPLGYVAAQAYLSAFAERIDLTPAPFALSLAITLTIAWAAVIGVVLKAATMHPASVLRRA
ncbi:MAG TPA: ABC transporter permease [Hyphomonadaceae bacterium]|jgi:putative ABC transport system permease protein|nr:ABC transporter permease [Hyphomonadaceae bacterium]